MIDRTTEPPEPQMAVAKIYGDWDYEYPVEPPAKKKKKGKGSSAGVIGKSSKLIKLLKTTKVLKPLVTVGTLMGSVFAYSFALGFWFSLWFVLMILVHEMGHVFALKIKGFKASAPVFIPFLGAAIFAPDFGDRDDEAYIGYAGPLVGGAAAAVLLAATVFLNDPPDLLRVVTYTALFINLFNLVPIRPLDGGRVTQAIGPWFRWIGLAILVGGTIALRSPGFLIVWMLILMDFNMPARLKFWLAGVVYASMLVMELGGIGYDQGTVWNAIDGCIGFLFLCMYFIDWKSGNDTTLDDARPALTRNRKWVWFALYLAISVALGGLMVVSASYLPAGAR